MPVRHVYACDRCGRESRTLSGWLVITTGVVDPHPQRIYLCASCHQSFEKFLNPGDPFA